MRLLIVEDDRSVAEVLRRGLAAEGHVIDVVSRGDEALWLAQEVAYDAIVLDVNLPDRSGFEICRALRDSGHTAKILLLTSRGAVADRVEGLDSGADDYLPKPFDIEELAARLRALNRRAEPVRDTQLEVGDLVIDPVAHTVRRCDQVVDLTSQEFKLLELLVQRDGQVVRRDELRTLLWDFAAESGDNVIHMAILRLRRKIDAPFGLASIETVRGVGYRFRSQTAM